MLAADLLVRRSHEGVEVAEHDPVEHLPAAARFERRAVRVHVPEPETQEGIGQPVDAPARPFGSRLGHGHLPADDAHPAQHVEVLADARTRDPGVPGDLVRPRDAGRQAVQNRKVGAGIPQLFPDQELGLRVQRSRGRQGEGVDRVGRRCVPRDLLRVGGNAAEDAVGDGPLRERPARMELRRLGERHRPHLQLRRSTPVERRPRIRHRGVHHGKGRSGEEQLDRAVVRVPGVLQQRVDARHAPLQVGQLVQHQGHPFPIALVERVLDGFAPAGETGAGQQRIVERPRQLAREEAQRLLLRAQRARKERQPPPGGESAEQGRFSEPPPSVDDEQLPAVGRGDPLEEGELARTVDEAGHRAPR